VFVKFIFALNQDDFFYLLSLETVLSVTAIGFQELLHFFTNLLRCEICYL